jgi:hypothetical protein
VYSIPEDRIESPTARPSHAEVMTYYAYYGMGGNSLSLHKIYRFAERYWRKMLSSRSQRGKVVWETFYKIRESFPLRRPRLYVPFAKMQTLAVL